MVGDHPVVLFGHGPVEAAQPGFEVHEWDVGGVGGQRAGDRGVGVAVDGHDGGRLGGEGGFEA